MGNDSAHQTLTLMFVTTVIIKNKNIENKKVTFIVLLLVYFRSYEFFILSSVFIIYNQLISLMKKTKLSFNSSKHLNFITTVNSLEKLYSFGYVPYNANFEYWNQFVWLPKIWWI